MDVLRNLPKEGHDYRHVTRLQSETLFDNSGNPVFHHLLRFETLQRDWDLLCKRIGKPLTELPHLNATQRRSYREYFTQEARDLFEQHFGPDIQKLNYLF